MSWLTPEVIEAVRQHMNSDHVEDNLLIVKGLGGRADAQSATLDSIDLQGAVFSVSCAGGPQLTRIPWRSELVDRAQIRSEVVQMYHQACQQLGLTPRGQEQH